MSIPNEINYYTSEDYYSLPEDERAELMDGQFIAQATPSTNHQKILLKLISAIDRYIENNHGQCEVFPAPFSVELSEITVVEPDISVVCDSNKITSKGCKGAPDFIIEITSTNSRNDYIKKLWLYENYGVREYWIVNPIKQTIFVYFFEKDSEPSRFTFDDIVKVNIFKTLEINFANIKGYLI